MGTLGGFPNPPATTPLGKAERSQRDHMRTLAVFPNPPATSPLGKADRSQRDLLAVFQLFSASSAAGSGFRPPPLWPVTARSSSSASATPSARRIFSVDYKSIK